MKYLIPTLFSVLISFTALASDKEKSCPVNEKGEDTFCEHKEWREEATLSDDGSVRTVSLPENSERQLIKQKVTLWSLPIDNTSHYTHDDLEQVKVDVSSTHFTSASATINLAKVKRVDELLNQLKGKKSLKLEVIGHTDSQQLSLKAQRWFKDNQALSQARAKAVANYLQKQLNLSNASIIIKGKGSKEPIASNATPSGMAKNRRVEILVSYENVVKSHQIAFQQVMSHQHVCQGEMLSKQSDKGFNIRIDGESNAGLVEDNEDEQRCIDKRLSVADIRLQYDNLAAAPLLNASAWPATFVNNETVKFNAYSNYLAWVERAEIRIFKAADSDNGKPLQIIKLDNNLSADWDVKSQSPEALKYRLRVYDKKGRFDETTSLPLWRVAKRKTLDDEQLSAKESAFIAYGKTRLEKHNIPVQGGSVTVSGRRVPGDESVFFMGRSIPVDSKGNFVARQIVPNGRHTIEVVTLDSKRSGTLYWRNIEFKSDDWFYVAIADITAGRYKANNNAVVVTKDKQHLADNNFIDGRLAFYTKGKWRNKYTVTASADTREQPLEDLFSTFMDKDPRSLLRRLNDKDYYPVYGDESTLVEDAPTQGKFYAKIEDARSSAMWGNFKIVQQETDLAQINRGLYGAVVDWNSESFNSRSESITKVNVFAAEPGTQAAREEFRGTGGSLYYLGHQDIVNGSERVQVEVRDKDSGIVLNVNSLVAGQDYQEDAIQGRILLTRALPSTADDSQLVRAGSYSGHPVFLVVNYEYVGNLTNFDELAVGGRASHWLSDSVRLGITGSHQQRDQQDQNLTGLDVLFRKTAETYLKLEAARTEGPGVSSNGSIDGGFSFSSSGVTPSNDQTANAFQLESGFVFNDLELDVDGKGHVYLRRREKNFTAPGQQTSFDTNQFGGGINVPLNDKNSVSLKVDLTDQKGGVDQEIAEANVHHKLNEDWRISAGVRGDSRKDNTGTPSNNNDGDRVDLTLQADYGIDEEWGAFGFVQGSLLTNGDRDKNNRLGLGGHFQANDRLGLNGEVSSGTGGFGALIGADYRLSDRTTTYLNYALDPDNANSGIGNRQGKLVSGLRTRYSDSISVYGEEQLLHGESNEGLTHAYGVDLIANEQWNFGLAVESGHITNKNSKLRRRAASFSANYKFEDVKYGGNLEYRRDNIDGDVRNNWLTRNNFAYMVNEDWRMRFQLDLALSDNSNDDFFDADYAELIWGYAYRPIDNDELNLLVEYKYLADQSPSDQFTASEQQNEFEQRSHVFSVDATYDLNPRWAIGGKYATRVGELRAGRGTGEWFRSQAQLGVVRLDWHVVRHWDALIEARVLDIDEAEDRRAGFLAALYRHFGDHLKVGVGYNFTDFSDDLTDLDYDSKGVFFNVVGKW